MAKALVVRHGGNELSLQLDKVDRKKLYGYVDTEVEDAAGRGCQLAILGGDGRTLVGRGGSALLMLDPAGNYCPRTAISPVGIDDKPVARVESTLGTPIDLSRRATVDEYLGHSVRAVYALTPPMGAEALLTELRGGAIYTFPFSYRGGLNPDTGFLLAGSDGTPFLAVGQRAQLQFVSLAQLADPDEPVALDEDGGDEDDMDFGMM